jgi:hypothetical protein
MSSGAPPASLRSLFSELEQLFQTETQERVSTSVQAAERAMAEHLNQSVRRLRQAVTFSEIATILCDASVRFADACAVFQVDKSAVACERVRGAAREDVDSLRFPTTEAAAFAAVIESGEPLAAICSAGEVSPAVVEFFGHEANQKAFLFPLTVDRRAVGILYATGQVESAALELLTQAAVAVLETRLRRAPREIPAAAADFVQIAPASADKTAAAQSPWDTLSPADRALHLRAQRFARVQVSEIRLYHSDAVKAGRAGGDLYAVLQEVMDEARDAYRRDFLAATPTMVDYLHLEVLRTLAHDNPTCLGANYPGPLVVDDKA